MVKHTEQNTVLSLRVRQSLARRDTILRIDVNGWDSTIGVGETGLPGSRNSEKKGMDREHVG